MMKLLLPRDSLGTAPPQYQSILGVLLRAIYNHIRFIIQLLLSGGSIQEIQLILGESREMSGFGATLNGNIRVT